MEKRTRGQQRLDLLPRRVRPEPEVTQRPHLGADRVDPDRDRQWLGLRLAGLLDPRQTRPARRNRRRRSPPRTAVTSAPTVWADVDLRSRAAAAPVQEAPLAS